MDNHCFTFFRADIVLSEAWGLAIDNLLNFSHLSLECYNCSDVEDTTVVQNLPVSVYQKI